MEVHGIVHCIAREVHHFGCRQTGQVQAKMEPLLLSRDDNESFDDPVNVDPPMSDSAIVCITDKVIHPIAVEWPVNHFLQEFFFTRYILGSHGQPGNVVRIDTYSLELCSPLDEVPKVLRRYDHVSHDFVRFVFTLFHPILRVVFLERVAKQTFKQMREGQLTNIVEISCQPSRQNIRSCDLHSLPPAEGVQELPHNACDPQTMLKPSVIRY